MKIVTFLIILLHSTYSFADCGFNFGETKADKLLCDSINLNRVQNFFRVSETAYTNPSEAEDFKITRLFDRNDNEVNIEMSITFSTVYIDDWASGDLPELETDTCNVYLTKSYEEEGWVFSYAGCETMGEFNLD